MLPDRYNLNQMACGRPQLFRRVLKSGLLIPIEAPVWNTIVYSAAEVLARLAAGQPGYKIGGFYFEFVNLASPGDPVSPPAYDRSGAAEYYNSLEVSLHTDFVRVPLLTPPALSTTDALKYVLNQGLFTAQTSGGTGRWGKPFTVGANSTVFGLALVAMPNADDPSQDVVYSRVYPKKTDLVTPLAVPKLDGEEISAAWPLQWL